jgi:hypothetical protein
MWSRSDINRLVGFAYFYLFETVRGMKSVEEFKSHYPFLSCIKSNDIEYIGIIINFDNNLVSIYDLNAIKSEDQRRLFLELGEAWWWESNRKIPINIFLKQEMNIFKYSIKTFNSKDMVLVFGHQINLNDLAEKRIKRKSIQLIRIPKI